MADFFYMDPAREDAILRGHAQNRARLEAARKTATVELAQQVVRNTQRRPNAPAGLAVGAAVGGLPDEEYDRLADKVKPGRDWFERSMEGSSSRLSGLVTLPFRQAYEQLVKPVIRGAFLIGDTLAQEVVQRPLTALSAAAGDGIGGQTFGDAYRQYGSSVGVQAVQDLASGRASFSDKDNPETEGTDESFLGQGFFAGGATAQRSYDERTLEIDGQRANLGRALPTTRAMGAFGTWAQDQEARPVRAIGNFVAPGEAAYNVVAGVSQFAADVLLDPLAIITGGTSAGAKGAAKGAKALGASAETAGRVERAVEGGLAGAAKRRKTYDTVEATRIFEALKAEGGAINGTRKTVLIEQAEGLLKRPEVLESLAGADRYTIWRSMAKNGTNSVDMDVVRALGDATEQSDVAQILLEQVAKGNVHDKGFYQGQGKFRKAVQNSTLSGTAPRATVHHDDLAGVADTFDNWAKIARVDEAERAAIFNRVLDATDQTDVLKIAQDLVTKPEYGKDHEALRRIIHMLPDDEFSQARKFGVGSDGQLIPSPLNTTKMVDGVEVQFPTAQLTTEMIQRGFEMPDIIAVRRAAKRATHLEQVYDRKGWELGADAARFITRDIFKPLAILRPAYIVRIGLEEQARLAAAGYDSLLNHPARWMMANVRAHDSSVLKGDEVSGLSARLSNWFFTGAPELGGETLDVAADTLRVITGDASGLLDDMGRSSVSGAPLWDDIAKVDGASNTAFLKAWQDELVQLRGDSAARQLAGNGGDLEDFVAWARTDKVGQNWVQKVSRLNDKAEGLLSDDNLLREFGQTIRHRVMVKTGGEVDELGNVLRTGDADLLDAIATSSAKKLSADNLKGMIGVAPQKVKVAVQDLNGTAKGRMDSLVDGLFDVITGKPTSYLARYPAFRQSIIRNIEESIDTLAGPLRKQVVDDVIRDMKLTTDETRKLKRALTLAPKGDGIIDDAADYYDLIKNRSATQVKELLFDVTQRSNAQVALEPIFPFLDAWKEVTTTWGRLTKEDPSFLMKTMQGYQSLQDGGTVYANDFGEQVFAYPGGRALSAFFANEDGQSGAEVGMDFEGRVQGANIVAQGVGPGFGPLVNWAVGTFDFFDNRGMEDFKEFIAPFGTDISDSGDLAQPGVIANALLPAWSEKLMNAWSGGDNDPVQWNATVGDAAKALVVTGRYDPASPDGKKKLLEDAEKAAFWTLTLRGIVQGVAITGPSATWKVNTGAEVQDIDTEWDPEKDPDGRWHSLGVLAQEYRLMLEGTNYDASMASQLFIEQYGIEPFYVSQAKTKSIAEAPVTTDGNFWMREHQDAVDKYPSVAGHFVPAEMALGELDYSVYAGQVDRGERQSLTAKQQVELANKAKAFQMYNAAKAQLEGVPNSSRFLRQVRDALDDQFPGWYGDVLGVEGKADSVQKTKDLRAAMQDPSLGDSPLVPALQEWFAVRDQIGAIVEARGAGQIGAAANADLRQALLAVGSQIATRDANFAPVWDRVLKREVDDT